MAVINNELFKGLKNTIINVKPKETEEKNIRKEIFKKLEAYKETESNDG